MAGACKKFLNIFNAVFVTLIGAALIALLAAGYALLSNIRDNLVEMVSVNYYATAIFVAAILLVILLTFGGICGVLGSFKENSYCLLFYAIISVICMVWFLGLSIALLKAPEAWFNGNCTNIDYFGQLQNYTLSAENSVCKSNCQCYLTTTSQALYNASTLTTYLPNITTDSTKAVKSQDCANTAWNTTNMTTGATVMAYIEPLLSCTSWCNLTTSPLVIYRFSNINNGVPTAYCYDLIQTAVLGYSRTGYIIGFIMTGITAMAFLLGLWLRCEVKEEEEQRGQFGGAKHGESATQMRMY